MKYMILWSAADVPSLYESEQYDTKPEADAELATFKQKYPWNTYLLVAVEEIAQGTGINPTLPVYTVVSKSDLSFEISKQAT